MRLLWLPDVLRSAGLVVHEVDGWRDRGSSSWGPIEGIICHATAGSRTSTDAGEINVLVNGRPGLSGPIAQLYLSRTGHWHVIASGRSNHALTGWAGPNQGLGNSALLGVEAQHDNRDEPWTSVQYDSYARGVAALTRKLAIPVARVAGHKEHQPWPPPSGQTSTKSDPTFDMAAFRSRVSAELSAPAKEDEVLTKEQAEQLAAAAAAADVVEGWRRGMDPSPGGRHVYPVRWIIEQQQHQAATAGELVAIRAALAGLTGLVQTLAAAPAGAPLTPGQLEDLTTRLEATVAQAGRQAQAEVLARLSAAGEALTSTADEPR